MNPNMLFILVCYHNEMEVISFIRNELARQTFQSYHCIVVDNGPDKEDRLKEIEKDNKVFIERPGQNLGYFGGAAYGLKEYTAKYERPPYVILCNTDLHFANPGFLESLHNKCMQGGFEVWGPDIISKLTGRHQNPYIPERLSKRKLQFFRMITSSYWLYNAFLLFYYSRKRVKQLKSCKEGNYYALHGSFLLFTNSFFAKGGSLDYGSFLFGEEIFLGELALKYGMLMHYDPGLSIIHDEHKTTGIFKKKINVKYLNQSYKYIMNEYYI